MNNKLIITAITVVGLGVVGWWIKGAMNLPGESVPDLGRDHRTPEELAKVEYNSNPPTSGPHDPDWVRPGNYEVPQDKYKLVHSLEHGYIEFHYNCTKQLQKESSWEIIPSVSAHDGEDHEEEATPSATASSSATLEGEAWKSTSCTELRNTLTSFTQKLNLKRIIVQPNPDIDHPIVIVAWARILKMDAWDEKLAEKFARAFHNKGPEQTME